MRLLGAVVWPISRGVGRRGGSLGSDEEGMTPSRLSVDSPSQCVADSRGGWGEGGPLDSELGVTPGTERRSGGVACVAGFGNSATRAKNPAENFFPSPPQPGRAD